MEVINYFVDLAKTFWSLLQLGGPAVLLFMIISGLFVVGLIREVKNTSPRAGLKEPRNAFFVCIPFLIMAWILPNPLFALVGIGFAWIGMVGLYKQRKQSK